MLSFAGANLDPARYPNPETFDLERGSSQHLGMGAGSHFCLGAWLARSIVDKIVRELLFERPRYEIDLTAVVPAAPGGLRTFDKVPARFVRRDRAQAQGDAP
jgi:cytochrome P450